MITSLPNKYEQFVECLECPTCVYVKQHIAVLGVVNRRGSGCYSLGPLGLLKRVETLDSVSNYYFFTVSDCSVALTNHSDA